jgi:hypothetical protein
MNILLGYRQDVWRDRPVETYARSVHHELQQAGHSVTPVGEGHELVSAGEHVDEKDYDLFLEIDCGRNQKGEFGFEQPTVKFSIPSAVWFIDSHGQPDLHQNIAHYYSHIFFAVWFRRDLFAAHNSAHFLANATDLRWFNDDESMTLDAEFDFGFFGSKGGLDRADPLKSVCINNNWSYDIRQVGRPYRHKWPMTRTAMANCNALFNHGQKHDVNQRIFESIVLRRPLINNYDVSSGIDKLLKVNQHYIPYESYTYVGLEDSCRWVYNNPVKSRQVATQAYNHVTAEHLVSNRVELITEIVCAKL